VQIKHEIRAARLRWHDWSFNLLSGLYKATLWLRVGYFGALGRWEMFETAGGLLGETLGGKFIFSMQCF